MFEPIERIDLYGDGIGYVELWPSWYANQSVANRVETVATIATLSYGNDAAKNPQRLYDDLKKSKHSSVFEFVPLVTKSLEYKNGSNNKFLNSRTDDFWTYPDDETSKSFFSLYKIKVPIFVMRQFVRHRNHSILEMSRRYVKDSKKPFEFYKYEEDKFFYDLCVFKYQEALSKGVLPQEARKFIPVGAYTEFFWMNNWNPISGLKNLFELRLDAQHTQAETVEMASAMYKLIEKHQPILFNQIRLEE